MGLMVVSSMEDELLTMTAHDLQLACLLTPRELALDGSIQAVQLDNQSLDALQPVVLGPAGVVTSGAPFELFPAPFLRLSCAWMLV